jgi:hypothetical protein
VFERAKAFHALDRAATVTGLIVSYLTIKFVFNQNLYSYMYLINTKGISPFTCKLVSVFLISWSGVRLVPFGKQSVE